MSDAPDTRAVSIITDHAFEPRVGGVVVPYLGWERCPHVEGVQPGTFGPRIELPPAAYLCAHCRLAEAAHLDTTVTREEKR